MTASSPNTPDLRKAITGGFIAILVLVGILLGTGAFYTVDAAQQAVVLQFGRPVGDPVTSPGLHFKMPFIQEVRFFDRRIQAWDGDPNQIPTRGREFISVDTTARWRIVDALKFLQSVRDERGALSRLDDILDSVVRDMVSSTDLVEIVRSSDWKVTTADLERAVLIEENVSELTRPIELGRQQRPGAGDLGVPRDAVRRGLGAMRGAERVVDVNVAQRCDLAGEGLVVLLLALVDAAVLEQHHLARLHVHAADPVAPERHLAPEQFAQAPGDGGERILRPELAFLGPPQVRGDHHRGAFLQREADARQRGADARVVGDGAGLVLRHIEIGADEDPLAAQLKLGHALEAHDVTSRSSAPRRRPACGC